jgi:hypothetical protein
MLGAFIGAFPSRQIALGAMGDQAAALYISERTRGNRRYASGAVVG